ncbi:MAG: S8 family serine peptidase, partial [Ilumatobacter sp.]|uniref:S8 family serine peptidase n=1 Tax=Ilumatobacter sp. TaxID=1967498 RepID=UPI003C7302AB
MNTFSALPGREWELALDTGAARPGREWMRRRRHGDSTPGREWLRSSTSLAERSPLAPSTPSSDRSVRSPRPLKRLAAALALVGLGALAFAIDSPDTTANVATPAPVEPFVDAAELPAGSLYHLVDQIGARQMWESGYTGAGVNVAVVDTGVARVDSLDADGKIVGVVDLSAESVDPTLRFGDSVGHGTHMAGIIAGSETDLPAASAVDAPQEFKGVAPEAGIVSVKVAGGGVATDANDVIAGVNWVVDNADDLDISVLNLSYNSGSGLPYQEDALTAALERAWQAGIVVVTPAGNEGPEANGLDSPAIDPHFIAVGGVRAIDEGFEIAEWSSNGDGVRNPDVTAPGAHIQSLRAPGSDADVNHPEGFVDDETYLGSGTSQSSAVVAGAAALLLDAHPEWTNDQVKSALMTTAVPLAGVSDATQGNGTIRVDLASVATDLSQPNSWPTASVDAAEVSVTPSQGFESLWT